MTAKIVRLCDFERRSKQSDNAQSPCEADVIVLPVVRIERTPEKLNDHFPAMPWSQ